MIQHIQAIYEAGVLKPLEPLDLKERDLVSLAVERLTDSVDAADQNQATLFEMLDEVGLIGCVKDGPLDLSTNPTYLAGFDSSGS